MASFFIVLGTRLQCNIISYEYSGDGASQGKASERNMYADIQATYNSIKQRYHIPDSKIILYGQNNCKNIREISSLQILSLLA